MTNTTNTETKTASELVAGDLIQVQPGWIGRVEYIKGSWVGVREVIDAWPTSRIDEIHGSYVVTLL